MRPGTIHRKTYHAIYIINAMLLMGLLLLCTACSTDPNWRAPVEVRTANSPPTQHPANTRSDNSQPIIRRTDQRRPPINPSAKYYTIQQGDTLFSIAWRSNNDVDQLAAWNRIQSPDLIYPGQNIRLYAPPHLIVKKNDSATPSQTSKPTKTGQDTTARQPGRLNWHWPLSGQLASTYKANDPARKGIKIIGKPGSTIQAAESGRVVYSGDGLIGYGLLVIIKHNEQYLSAYGHNRKLLVKQGQQIAKGTKIAELGTTNDGKALLHFEIRQKGKPTNPLSLLPKQ